MNFVCGAGSLSTKEAQVSAATRPVTGCGSATGGGGGGGAPSSPRWDTRPAVARAEASTKAQHEALHFKTQALALDSLTGMVDGPRAEVCVIEASGLRESDSGFFGDHSDPFVRLTERPSGAVHESPVVLDSLEPHWNCGDGVRDKASAGSGRSEGEVWSPDWRNSSGAIVALRGTDSSDGSTGAIAALVLLAGAAVLLLGRLWREGKLRPLRRQGTQMMHSDASQPSHAVELVQAIVIFDGAQAVGTDDEPPRYAEEKRSKI
ncbi:hypothetical protein T492DRAFT_1142150 [Pavlovales sp. CCMP2436]|nr:hypothetical protein T492DRAFT_1142150 [Pavlovales sp. CCMP2436]